MWRVDYWPSPSDLGAWKHAVGWWDEPGVLRVDELRKQVPLIKPRFGCARLRNDLESSSWLKPNGTHPAWKARVVAVLDCLGCNLSGRLNLAHVPSLSLGCPPTPATPALASCRSSGLRAAFWLCVSRVMATGKLGTATTN